MRSANPCRGLTSFAAQTRVVAPVMAGLILGLGGVVAGSSLVQASEQGGIFSFFEQIFRGPGVQPQPAPVSMPHPARPRYASLPTTSRITAVQAPRQTPRLARLVRPSPAHASRAASAALTASALGARTVCVRACDGYLFPLGRLASRSDIPLHEAACAAACPNAATSLYTLGARQNDLDRAVGLDGRPYRALQVANLYRTKRVEQCSCQPEGVAAVPLPIERDPTARVGDVVATPSSARVVVSTRPGGYTVVDFREAGILSRRERRSIDHKIDVVRREADARAAEQDVRQSGRAIDRASRIRVAQMGAGDEAGGFGSVQRRQDVDVGFAVVRVVVSSPFIR
ncbi:DUF2865 domain-containing protein [Methylobacterium sp. 10]|uniref:DUF2865 domain-containing protein n=1 Tax=Methylobacterium sp. 10 TaxID=1101191 RepID=UPI0004B0A70A|nr:DUF2865 domain-containing protein [Methylobacterium sp. 10]